MKHIVKAPVTPEESIQERKGRALARAAAAEGVVLLKNEGVLPIKEKKIALFGSGARKTVVGGTGSGAMHERYSVSIEEGLKNAGFEIVSEEWINRYDTFYEEAYQNWHDHIEELVKDIANPFQVLGVKIQNKFVYPTGIPVTEEDIKKADCDTAVYVIARQAGEGNDRSAQEADYYLDQLEYENLKMIAEHYKRTLVVINSGGIIDTSFMEELPIGALLFYGQGGEEGGNAFADVASGRVSPSGKLTDTWAKRYEDYPSAGIFSVESDPKVQDYKEGIYVGYRYFDTFHVEPRYHFGYGLSYTAFSLETKTVTVRDGNVTLEVEVGNTGEAAGKEVIQVYGSVPYGVHGSEYQRLLTFAKTKELAPGEYERIRLSFELRELSVYEEESASYVLEPGNYILRVGNASNQTKAEAVLRLAERKVTEICTNICPLKKGLEELKASKCSQECPQSRGEAESKIPFDMILNAAEIPVVRHEYEILPVYEDESVKQKIESMTVEQIAQLTVGGTTSGEHLVTALGASGSTTSKLYEEAGIPNIVLSDGPAGLNLSPRLVVTREGDVKSLDLYEQYNFGSFREFMLSRIGKPEDGTVHYQYATALPCSTLLAQTWNVELVEEIGQCIGAEMEAFGVTVWLAPGMNIHRNPLCGRVFEYYSEDPVVSGYIAAALTNGVQSHPGKAVSLKHFCANNSEVERDHSNSNLSERALREIYLKGFETALKRCNAKTIMASYNKINEVYNTNNYDLLVKVLRCEWGFEGLVMSDWNAVSALNNTADVCQAAASQCDLIMPGEAGQVEAVCEGVKNGTVDLDDLKRCAGRVLSLIRENTVIEVCKCDMMNSAEIHEKLDFTDEVLKKY